MSSQNATFQKVNHKKISPNESRGFFLVLQRHMIALWILTV